MTFAEGFAQAFIAGKNRREDREQAEEDMMFKYKMENLMADKKLRVAKQTTELENARKAQTLAAQYGDQSTAPYWQTQLNNGVDYDNLYKGIGNGDYQPNKAYVKPKQTVQVPAAVSGTVAYDTDTQGPEWNAVNKKIDKIDPSLRKGTTMPTVDDTSSANMLVFSPKNQKNLPDMATLMNNVNIANASGDPMAIRKANQELDSAKQAIVFQSEQQAKAQGNFASQQGVILDQNNRIVPGGLVHAETRRDPETGKYVTYNIEDPTVNDGQGVPISGNFRYLDKNAIERMNQVRDKWGQAAKETQDGVANFSSAVRSAALMDKIAREDPTATTKITANTLTTLQNAGGELGAAWNKLWASEQQVMKNRQDGNVEAYEKDAVDYGNALQEFYNATANAPDNQRTVANAALYRAAKQNLVIQLQSANGLSASKASDKDFDNYMKLLGDDSVNYEKIAPVIRQTMTGVMGNLDARRRMINSDGAAAGFKRDYGVDLGLEIPRLEDVINSSDSSEEEKILAKSYLKTLTQGYSFGVDNAGAQGAAQKGLDIQPPVAQGSQPQPGYRDPRVSAPNSQKVQPPVQQNKSNQTLQDRIINGEVKIGDVITSSDGKKYKLKNFDPTVGLRKENFEAVKEEGK